MGDRPEKRIFWWQPYGVGCKESTGITAALDVEEDRLPLYRKLLPPTLEVPARPQLMFYVYHFTAVFPWPTMGYREASVCLRARLPNGVEGWRVLHMAVSSLTAWAAGLLVGYPKYIPESLTLHTPGRVWSGTIEHKGRSPFTLEFTPADVAVWWKGIYRQDDPFLLPVRRGSRINLMELAIHREDRLDESTGNVTIRVDSDDVWTGFMREASVTVPGLLHNFGGKAYLTRRGRKPV